MKYLIIILFLGNTLYCFSQNKTPIRKLDSLEYSNKLDSLKLVFSNNKTVLADYELATYLALSYFPELIDTRIAFKRAKIKTTFNARPTVLSLIFRSKDKRKYIIRVNNQLKDSIINFRTIPFNAKVGLLGHELSHIKDYHQQNFFQVFGRLLSYRNKKSKARFEKEIDQSTIKAGLGWQLYDWSKFVLEESNAKLRYKEFKGEIYLTPNQISNIIKSSSNKQD